MKGGGRGWNLEGGDSRPDLLGGGAQQFKGVQQLLQLAVSREERLLRPSRQQSQGHYSRILRVYTLTSG